MLESDEVSDRIVSTTLFRDAVKVGSCLASESDRVNRDDRVPVCEGDEASQLLRVLGSAPR